MDLLAAGALQFAMLLGGAAVVAFILTARLVGWARTRSLVAVPNERSSHSDPTPTGGGLAIVAVSLLGCAAMALTSGTPLGTDLIVVLLLASTMAAIGFVDDRRDLSAVLRLGAQCAAAGVLVGLVGPFSSAPLPGFGLVSLGGAGALLTVLWIVGLTNAYNFMDGIDGLAASQGAVAGIGWGIAGVVLGHEGVATAGWLLAGSCLGFGRLNWAPARIFMGDVGSAFLGFMFAGLPVLMAGADPAVLVLGICAVWPFLFDAGFTILRRAMSGENLFRAHRKHLYQRLVIAGWSHRQTTSLYTAAAAASTAAGLALLFDAPAAQSLVMLVLPGVALGLWGVTVSEEWRRERALELAPREGQAGWVPSTRNRYILLADLALVVFAAFASFAMRFDGVFVLYRREFPLFLSIVLLVKPLVFLAFGLYTRYWRYASVWDLLAVVLAVSAAEIVAGTSVIAFIVIQRQFFEQIIEFPRSVLAIDWLVTLVCAGGVRMSVRVFGESLGARGSSHRAAPGARARRVLIVGAGDAGVMVLREIRRNPALEMDVVGFLDDDPVKHNKRIHNTRVLAPIAQLAIVAREQRVDEVIIAVPTAPGSVVRRVIESCREAGVTFTAVPGVFELLDGQISVSRLRNVEIGDLLRRTQVSSSPDGASYLSGQTVLVTGAGGSIGSELCHQIARARPARLVLLGHGENSIFAVQNDLRERTRGLNVEAVIADVRDADRLRVIFEQVRPSTVFHAAAHKHVPLMEANPQEAITNNVFGTRNVVNAALASGTERLVLISTDKAVQPSSVMGASKRIAEAIVTDAAKRSGRAFVVVRFGNVLGSRGSVVPTFKRQIELGQPISVTHPEMTRFFMTIPEAVHLVLQAGGLGRGGELFVLNMGEPVLIVDLARDLIRLSGLEIEDIPIVFSGLRPGEKLEESLWEPGSRVEPTSNPDVLRVVEPVNGLQEINETLAFLESAVQTGDRTSVCFALAASVPNFVSVASSDTHG